MSLQTTRGGIEIAPIDGSAANDWDSLVDRSPQGTVFHYRAFLETVADEVGATLHPLVGHKGQEPVGLFPVFEITRNVVTTVFSPPPRVGLPQLGPAMLGMDGLKRRRAEKRIHRFVEGSLEWIEETLRPSYVNVRTHPDYVDLRPFVWQEFDVNHQYTYVVDLQPGPEAVLADFSSDARRNVRSTDEDEYTIVEGGDEAIDPIITHLVRRHEEQGLDFPLDAAFVRAVAAALGDDGLRAYVCRVDGDYAGGMIVLDDGDTIYRWQGGARPPSNVAVPVNDLLDWHVMEAAMARGRTRYDLVGANTPDLCEYKSKFGPALVPYAEAERGTRTMRFVSNLYRRFG